MTQRRHRPSHETFGFTEAMTLARVMLGSYKRSFKQDQLRALLEWIVHSLTPDGPSTPSSIVMEADRRVANHGSFRGRQLAAELLRAADEFDVRIRQESLQLPPCPKCGTAEGRPCFSHAGNECEAHQERLDLAWMEMIEEPEPVAQPEEQPISNLQDAGSNPSGLTKEMP